MPSVHELLEQEHGLEAFFNAVRKPKDERTDTTIRDLVANAPLSVNSRARILASLWAAAKRGLLAEILEDHESMREPAVISKAIVLLDAGRRQRQLEAKLEGLSATARGSRNGRALHAKLHEVKALKAPAPFSATRSFFYVVRQWMRTIPAERLEFDCIKFDAHDVWKSVADMAHPRPSDFALPWFQGTVFGESAPAGTFVADTRALNLDNLAEMLERHPRLAQAYSVIRIKIDPKTLKPEHKVALATAMPLGDVLWHFEEVRGVNGWAPHNRDAIKAVDAVIEARLASGDDITDGAFPLDSFGKLCERMLLLRKASVPWWGALIPLAEELLEKLKAKREALLAQGGPAPLSALAAKAAREALEGDWELIAAPADDEAARAAAAIPAELLASTPSPAGPLRVAVLGDASGSMQVAINAACIVGAMMCALFEAELVFFNAHAFRSAKHASPRSAVEVLEVAHEVQANGGTAPAAALAEFSQAKQPIDLFIVVSDEGENMGWGSHGERFAALFARYKREVHPQAQVTFVSFLQQSDKGQMVCDMHKQGESGVKQQRFDPQRPDLSKFDGLFGQLMLEALESQRAQREAPAGIAPAAAPTGEAGAA
jgi:hypothetical protein